MRLWAQALKNIETEQDEAELQERMAKTLAKSQARSFSYHVIVVISYDCVVFWLN